MKIPIGILLNLSSLNQFFFQLFLPQSKSYLRVLHLLPEHQTALPKKNLPIGSFLNLPTFYQFFPPAMSTLSCNYVTATTLRSFSSRVEVYTTHWKICQLTRCSVLQHSSRVRSLMATVPAAAVRLCSCWRRRPEAPGPQVHRGHSVQAGDKGEC